MPCKAPIGILFLQCLPAEVGNNPWYHAEPPQAPLISLFSQHSYPCLQPQFDKSSKVLRFQFKLPFQAWAGDRSTGQVHNPTGDAAPQDQSTVAHGDTRRRRHRRGHVLFINPTFSSPGKAMVRSKKKKTQIKGSPVLPMGVQPQHQPLTRARWSHSYPGVLHGVLGGSWHPRSLPAAPTTITNSHSSAQSTALTHKQKSLPIFNRKSRISHYPFKRANPTAPAFFWVRKTPKSISPSTAPHHRGALNTDQLRLAPNRQLLAGSALVLEAAWDGTGTARLETSPRQGGAAQHTAPHGSHLV